MPVIQKAVANQTTRPLAPAGSVLSEAIPISELAEDHIRLCLYGPNRIGKSTLACQFPKPLLLVAMEPNKTGGATSVKKMPGIKYLRIASTEKAIRLAGELRSGTVCDLPDPKYYGKPYAAVVIDSATSYQDIALTELMGLDHAPVMLTWGMVGEDMYRQRSEKCREMLRLYLDLPCHTVIIAKEKDHNPPKGERSSKLTRGLTMQSFFAADLGGATANWLHDTCDCICRMYMAEETMESISEVAGVKQKAEIATGRMIRRLLTQYHPNFAAGIRSCTPDCVPEYINEPTFQKLKDVIDGKRIKDGRYTESLKEVRP